MLKSHNLRKGVAFAAHAIVARLNDIRFIGGWVTTSNVLDVNYIDLTIQSSPVAWLFSCYLYTCAPH